MFFGWFIDRYGTKIGYAVSIGAWSLAAMGHALVSTIAGFFGARVALGLGEGGNFPAAIKAVAQWFPQKERALATSLFNSGANVGAIIAPGHRAADRLAFGWHWAFIFAGVAGLVWIALWLPLFDDPGTTRAACRRQSWPTSNPTRPIPSESSAKLSWGAVLRHREAWSFIAAKFLTDPVWWFFLIWLPDFFKTTRHLDIKNSWTLLVEHLLDHHRAQHRGRLADGPSGQPGLEHHPRAQDGHVRVCAVPRLSIAFVTRVGRLDGGAAHRPGGRGAPGLVGEILHHRFRHVPQTRGGHGDRDRDARRVRWAE